MKPYRMGVDIGTTSTKAVLFDKKGKALSRHGAEYPLQTPAPGVAEQDPELIFQAVLHSIRECLEQAGATGDKVGFVAFSSAMHSLIVVDESGHPLTPSITWADNRSAAYADMIKTKHNGLEIYRRTGTPIHPMSPFVKLVWLRNERPELFKPNHKFISIKEYVFHRLLGQYVIDHSIASATGLLNLEALDWDEEALHLAGVTRKQLSIPVATTHALSGLKPEYAEATGLPADMTFIIGANDGVLSNLGVAAIDPGVVAVTIGTSGAVRTVTDKPVTDPEGRVFCYALTENHWVIGGPVNNGGMILRWIRDELASAEVETAKRLGIDAYELLTGIAAKVPPGSSGLLFHPYLAGERAPIWNSNARGSYFGLGMHHKKEHMIRAAMEGVIMNLYTVLSALQELIGPPAHVLATGGFARSELWRQMLADVFDQEVTVPESFESSCLGAVVLGMYGQGEIASLSEVKGMVGGIHTHKPDAEAAKAYRKLLPLFAQLPRLLEEPYAAIASFQKAHE
ncbi:gluconokinase [Paenibacillus sp. 1011MAR3C5]|uniref:gluconokinase n=1 Tax=Paenibacillus sp. 1011MAR3C5 TaxID=1675787 RepID=UPI000E6BCBF1|nr:gluconokinase [Paenibacillus sp. 1011MAR3C5]RJE88764.1 gluconokinase [Paenibacillus sp. 1011MAR3C5]